MADQPGALNEFPIFRNRKNQFFPATDEIAVEEPLEIRLGFGPSDRRQQESLAVTMRTPGHDFDLVAGFLFSEGIIARREDIIQMRYAGQQLSPESQRNIILAELKPAVLVDFGRLKRHFYTASSCGICGKASLEMVQMHCPHLLLPRQPLISSITLSEIPATLQESQTLFARTGGVHAAALFDATGNLLCLREDVGRHNALDKLIGEALESRQLPLKDALLLVSGRAGFELVQKALMAGIPVMAAVGAPSSLAIELAEAHNMTLIGFLRAGRFNIYSGADRIESYNL